MAHGNYYLDLCVEAFVVHEDAVLLRLHEKYSIWAGPGGHIDPGEDANEAVLREVWEEVGLRVELVAPAGWEKLDTPTNKDLVPPIFLNRHSITDIHDHSAFIFVARSASRDIAPQTEADLGVECVWADMDKLNSMRDEGLLKPEVYRYATTALSLAGGVK